MSACREQALIEAPVEDVWRVIADPSRYPEWASEVVAVTGLAEVAEGATFEQTTKGPLGTNTTTFEIERLDDLHEIGLRCRTSGLYSRWRLTPAREATFVEVAIGIEPTAARYALLFRTLGRRYMRRLAEGSVEGVRRVVDTGGEPDAG